MENYQAVFKRKELKYLLTETQLAALRPVLFSHTVPDAFAHSSILNLYYDTPDFRMIRRSQEKPAYKEKLRLRSYGVPQEQTPVFPEIKKKAEGIVYKRPAGMPSFIYHGSAPAVMIRSSGSLIGCCPPTAALRPASSSPMNGTPERARRTPLCA